jgi:diaminopimelate epimerase
MQCNAGKSNQVHNLIKVKVWERGAGLTKACGTAACATAVAGNLLNGLTDKAVDIEFDTRKINNLY